jgi:hypothetical protein
MAFCPRSSTGAAGALMLSPLLRTFVFGIRETDAMTLGIAAAVPGIVSLAACLMPAHRASPIDPMIALRHE